MAYNPYYYGNYQPTFYNGGNPYYQQQQQPMMQPQQQQQQQNQQPAIQQSGFVPVRSEQEARSYPVAPGNSITFKDENAPYCYVKTMGFNQLDQPVFERYRLVKEETPAEPQNRSTAQEKPAEVYATKSDLGAIWAEIEGLKSKLKDHANSDNSDNAKVEEETKT